MSKDLQSIQNLLEDSLTSEFYRKKVFEKYDQDKDGFLSFAELRDLVREEKHDIPNQTLIKIYDAADKNGDERLDFAEFVEMIHHPQNRSVFKSFISKYVKMLVPLRKLRRLGTKTGLYEEHYKCRFSMLGIIFLSCIQISFFYLDKFEIVKVKDHLMFDNGKQDELWRFLTYMLVHNSEAHLASNIVMQLVLGVLLLLVNSFWSILFIYMAGVLAGSLVYPIAQPCINNRLVGGSAGVYSFLTAHISAVIMNWREMLFPEVQLFVFLIYVIVDNYMSQYYTEVSQSSHFAGAVIGFLIGINVLRNINVYKFETILKWISVGITLSLILASILFNIIIHFKSNQQYTKC